MPFDTPLVIELRPSRRVLAWLGLLALSAAVAVLVSGLPLAWRLPLALVVLVAAGREARAHWLHWSGVRLAHDGRGRWALLDGQGGRRNAQLAMPALRGPGLLLLPVRIEGARGRIRRWLLVRDMMDSESFRRVCVRATVLDPGVDTGGRESDAP